MSGGRGYPCGYRDNYTMGIPDHAMAEASQDVEYFIGREADQRWGFQARQGGRQPSMPPAEKYTSHGEQWRRYQRARAASLTRTQVREVADDIGLNRLKGPRGQTRDEIHSTETVTLQTPGPSNWWAWHHSGSRMAERAREPAPDALIGGRPHTPAHAAWAGPQDHRRSGPPIL